MSNTSNTWEMTFIYLFLLRFLFQGVISKVTEDAFDIKDFIQNVPSIDGH